MSTLDVSPSASNGADNRSLPGCAEEIVAQTSDLLSGKARLARYAGELSERSDNERRALQEVISQLARHAADLGASDMDLGGPACNGQIWYRIDGRKKSSPEMGEYPDERLLDVVLLGLLTDVQRETLLEELSLDFSFELPPERGGGKRQRFRATMYFDNDHLGLNMRVIDEELRPLRSLGFHPNVQRGMLFDYVRTGLTLVTGVTGSGKSTTLDAVIDANNEKTPGHIVVIGKPIEYVHASKKCIVRHREVGKDVHSFKEGVIQAMRQDPDIVVIGEMRDPETIGAAMEVADTGHRVFSTLHTSSAVESLDRIVAEHPPWEQERVRMRLADTLTCVISQKLCPGVDGGRVLAKEVLWVTSSVRAAIKNDNTSEIYQMIWESTSDGQITLEQDLFTLVREQQITPETAMSYANNTKRLRQLM
jgi:twitching motility protein PilT